MKKQLKVEQNDSWVYILLLTTLSIFISATRKYTFNVYDQNISYSIIALPGVYFIINYISKKYDYKKALLSIVVSTFILVFYYLILSFAFTKRVDTYLILGEFASFFVSEIINITIYQFLLNNTRSPYILVLLTYLFSIIIYYLVYTMISLNITVQDGYWIRYFITIGIDSLIAIPVADFDKAIKRGE